MYKFDFKCFILITSAFFSLILNSLQLGVSTLKIENVFGNSTYR